MKSTSAPVLPKSAAAPSSPTSIGCLQRAQELLARTGLKMYEISDHVGYNSVEHFNHTFKKFLGISPSDYRNSAQKS